MNSKLLILIVFLIAFSLYSQNVHAWISDTDFIKSRAIQLNETHGIQRTMDCTVLNLTEIYSDLRGDCWDINITGSDNTTIYALNFTTGALAQESDLISCSATDVSVRLCYLNFTVQENKTIFVYYSKSTATKPNLGDYTDANISSTFYNSTTFMHEDLVINSNSCWASDIAGYNVICNATYDRALATTWFDTPVPDVWIAYNFSEEKTARAIKYIGYSGYEDRNFTIRGSHDNSTWTTLFDYAGSVATNHSLNFETPYIYKYWMINITKSETDAFARTVEVEFFAGYDYSQFLGSEEELGDTTPPTIEWVFPTPANTTTVFTDSPSAYLNTTITDESNTSAFFDWNYSLVGYWNFEYVLADGTVFDNSTYGNDGLMYNFTTNTTVTGQYGNALDFNSTAKQYVDCGNDSSLNFGTGDFSIDFWIKTEDSNTMRLIQKMDLSTAQGYEIYMTSKIEAYIYDGTNDAGGYPSVASLDDNLWHHVVLIKNSTLLFFYIDNNYDSGWNCSSVGDLDNINNFTIGKDLTPTDFFNGTIDEIRLHKRALSQEEINASYNNGLYRLYHDFTNLDYGTYDYFAYAIDIEGNENRTGLRTVTFAPLNPIIAPLVVCFETKPICVKLDDNTIYYFDNVNINGNMHVSLSLPVTYPYIFAHTNNTINVASAGDWHNVTFDEEEASPKYRITHTHNDNTNDTFTIIDDGVYDISYSMSFADSQANPTNHIVMRVVKNGAEIEGTLLEEDSTKQYSDFTISNRAFVYLVTGDEIKFQFTSDATTVNLTSHRTYGDHHDTSVVKIKRIA